MIWICIYSTTLLASVYRFILYYYVSIMCGLKLYITDCSHIIYDHTIEQLYIKLAESLHYHYWSFWSLFLYNCCTLENIIIYYREHQVSIGLMIYISSLSIKKCQVVLTGMKYILVIINVLYCTQYKYLTNRTKIMLYFVCMQSYIDLNTSHIL